jgi:hypothetical protein
MYGQNLSSAEYANQIRQQELAELMTQRGWSLNEINALLSGTQVGMPQMPSFTSASAAQPAPIYNAAVDASNADAAGLSAGLGGVSDVAQGIASIYAI